MKPKLRVYHTYQQQLKSDDQIALRESQEARAKRELSEMARDTLAWSTNLVSNKRYRLCPCRCDLIHLSRLKNDKHIDPSELIADWQVDEPDKSQSVDASMQEPVEVPLRPAASRAQIMWSRSMVDQLGRKTEDQIASENNVSWKQLIHWARSKSRGRGVAAGGWRCGRRGADSRGAGVKKGFWNSYPPGSLLIFAAMCRLPLNGRNRPNKSWSVPYCA